MALDRLTKVDGGGISTTSDYRVGIITASKFVGPFDGSGGNFSGVVTATNGVFSGNISAVDGNFSGNVTIGGTLTYEDVTNIDSVGIITAQKDIHVGAGLSVVGVGTFGSLDIGGDIDVDGHTNLDNVSVAGVTTFASTIVGTDATFSGNINNSPAGNGSISGFGAITIQAPTPALNFTETDADPDYRIIVLGGQLRIQDVTNSNANRFIINTDGTTSIEKNLNCLSDLDVDGHTNLDNGNVAGIVTFNSGAALHMNGGQILLYDRPDGGSNNLFFGTGGKAVAYHDGTNFSIVNNTGHSFIGVGVGNKDLMLYAQASGNVLLQQNTGVRYVKGVGSDASVQLFFNNNLRLNTTNAGVSIPKDLDVDGHTNLDNVSVAGVTTFSGDVVFSGDGDNITFDKSSDDLIFNNGTKAVFGTNSDGVEIYHASNNSFINDTGTGALILDGSKIRLRLSGSTQLETDTNGIVATGTAHRFQSGTSGDCELIIEADTDNNNENDNPRILFRQDGGSDWSAIGTNDNTLEISNSVSNGGILFKTGGTNGYTNATGRWKIDTNGHLLPNTAGAVNIGSTGAEIGNVYLADDKKVFLGSDQDFTLHHNNSHAIVKNTTGRLYVLSDDLWFKNQADNSNLARFLNGDTSLFYFAGNEKFRTHTTGILVTGEVAASQDYPSLKPTLDLNFAGTANLDPRVTFTRQGTASYVGRDGLIKFAAQNEPRFDHDPVTRECKGLLIEEQRKNIHPYSQDLSNWTVESGGSVTANTHISPAGDLTADSINGTQSGSSAYRTFPLTNNATYTFSFFMKYVSGNQNILISIGDAALTRSNTTFNTSTGALVSNTGGTATVNDVVAFPNGWYRYSITRTATSSSSGFIDFNHTSSTASVVAVWGAQVEEGAFTTSYIRTIDNVNVIRGADECYIDGQDFLDFYNQTEGTMISSHSILPDIPSTRNLYTYQISPTGATAYAPLRLLDKNGSYGNSLTAASVYNNSTVFLVQPSGSPVTVAGKKMLTAVSFKKDDYDASFNGENVQSDGSGDLYTADHISIGYYKPSPQAYLNGHIQRLTYYPFKLTNNQLKTITS